MSVGVAALVFSASAGAFAYFVRSAQCRRYKALRAGGMICSAVLALISAAYLGLAALLLSANR